MWRATNLSSPPPHLHFRSIYLFPPLSFFWRNAKVPPGDTYPQPLSPPQFYPSPDLAGKRRKLDFALSFQLAWEESKSDLTASEAKKIESSQTFPPENKVTAGKREVKSTINQTESERGVEKADFSLFCIL